MVLEQFEADAVVIGAGVVGLAIAAELARRGREVLILERNGAIGAETSSRNSEVVHAGLYYEAGSLKGRACVSGRDRLYAWCAERGVPHRRCGKLIVATAPEEEAALEQIVERAAGNGVTELERLSKAQTLEMEPDLAAYCALWSPLTGIVDTHAFMLSLQAEAEAHGAQLAFKTSVVEGRADAGVVDLQTSGDAAARISARTVVNAAGLWAQDVAACISGPHAAQTPPKIYFKGNYFSLSGTRAPFTRLIYPAPVPGGLGVHLTLDLGGAARFGPDVEPLETNDPNAINYQVAPTRGESFYAAIRRYWPGLPDGALQPAYSGVRPKIHAEYKTDFQIVGPADHGSAGLFNLFGIESPGLTGALTLGETVAERIERESA